MLYIDNLLFDSLHTEYKERKKLPYYKIFLT